MLNYRHLHYFWVVAKEGGFARAAERLDMAVQTVSAQVRALEKELGHELLKPAGRGVALTDAGRAALARAEQIFELGQLIPQEVRATASAPVVRLVVGLSDGLSKLAAHALAEARGMVFSMMPKPFANQPGSGLHFHVSLWAGEHNLFERPSDAPQAGSLDTLTPLSVLGQHFVAGVLHHAPALCALAAPTVNSYKRLTVGESLSGTTWAPANIAHGPNNRTALVRTLPGRFEWRRPDASANPYLATAALIAAGLDGVDRALPLPPAREDDLFVLPPATLQAQGIAFLPQSLDAALHALAADSVVTAALGETLTTEFLRLKRAEWTAYARHVSEWELDRYADAF